MTSIDTTKGLAARLGGWSARHKKTVLAAWFVFVAMAMMVSSFIPANKLTKADQFTGESGRAEKTLESSFPKPASEMVLLHSATLTTRTRRSHVASPRRRRHSTAFPWSTTCERPGMDRAPAWCRRTGTRP